MSIFRKHLFICVILTILGCSYKAHAQQSFNCDSFLKEELYVDAKDPQLTIKALKNLKHCGLDSLDVLLIINGPQIGTILMDMFKTHDKVTYKYVLDEFKRIMSSTGYAIRKANAEQFLAVREEESTKQKNYYQNAQLPVMRPLSGYEHYETKVTRYFLYSMTNIEDAKAYAKEADAPILIWFNALHCMNCIELEMLLNENDKLRKYIARNYVLLDVYADDPNELPVDKQVYSDNLQKKLETWGDYWADYQIRKFNSNAQPKLYIIDTEEQVLSERKDSDDLQSFIDFFLKGPNR